MLLLYDLHIVLPFRLVYTSVLLSLRTTVGKRLKSFLSYFEAKSCLNTAFETAVHWDLTVK